MVIIALGWKELGRKSAPKVIYCGPDMDDAMKAVQAAGKAKSIVLGEVLRGIEDRVIERVVFDCAVDQPPGATF